VGNNDFIFEEKQGRHRGAHPFVTGMMPDKIANFFIGNMVPPSDAVRVYFLPPESFKWVRAGTRSNKTFPTRHHYRRPEKSPEQTGKGLNTLETSGRVIRGLREML
jgi:hypothetical protein